MPTVSLFIRKDDLDKWKALENKSQAISDLLNQRAGVIKVEAQKGYVATIKKVERKEETPDLWKIPGVKPAVEAVSVCKGTHYMDRTDCGKEGCPWK